MPHTIIRIEDVMEANGFTTAAPVQLLMCKIESENAQASLLISGTKMIFSKNTALPSKHSLSKIPVALWMSISFIAS